MRRTGYRLRDLPGYALLLLAPPVALVRLVGWPLPDRLPTRVQWHSWLQEPLTWPTIVAAATIVGWLMWTIYAATAAVEVYRWISRRCRLPRLTVPAPMQAISAAVLGATAVSATGGAAQAAGPATATATHPDQPHTSDRHLLTVPSATGGPAGHGPLPRSSPASRGASQSAVYVVDRGDWLSAVAARYLGTPGRYPEIAALNRHLIPDPTGPDGPDWIYPGERYRLPADAHDRGPRRHAAGHTTATAGPRPADPATPGPPTPPEHTQRRPTRPADPDAVAEPPSPGTTPTATAAAGRRPTTPPAATTTGPDGGVSLPGGWLTLPLAVTVAAAAAIAWNRRRGQHTPGSAAAEQPRRSPSPSPARRQPGPGRPAAVRPAPAPAPAPAPEQAGLADPDVPPQDTHLQAAELGLAGLVPHIPARGLGLDGPGAHSAARALLLAATAANATTAPTPGEVVVPADTLTTLLGGTTTAGPGLHVTGTLAEALGYLLERVIDRRRTREDRDLDDLEVDGDRPGREQEPPILLLATTPPPDHVGELVNTLRLGAPVNVHAVLVGRWDSGDTTTVRADGNTNRGGERLAVLDTPSALRLLHMLDDAHTPDPDGTARSPAPSTPTDGEPADPPLGLPAAGSPEAAPQASPQTASEPAQASVPDDGGGPAAGSPQPHPPADNRPSARPKPGARVPIRLFGSPVIIDRDGNPDTQLRQHARQLLVYLAAHRTGADLRDIMEVIWPEATLRRAGERLATEVADLRRRIRHAAGNPHLQPVVNTGGRYHLNPDVIDLDLWRFTDALTQARTGDPSTRITALTQAIDAHTGPLAHGHDYDWIDRPREHYNRAGIRARLQLADLLTQTDPGRAAELATAAAALAPTDEHIAQQTMRALAHAGQPDTIAAQLQQLRQALHADGEHVSDQTTALAKQLQQDAAKRPRKGPQHPTA